DAVRRFQYIPDVQAPRKSKGSTGRKTKACQMAHTTTQAWLKKRRILPDEAFRQDRADYWREPRNREERGAGVCA
ncbi:MAG: hypothetical protein WAN81_24310, partial [Candidatus Binataceae bacterium]